MPNLEPVAVVDAERGHEWEGVLSDDVLETVVGGLARAWSSAEQDDALPEGTARR
jgi:hypothetical protein